MSHVPECWRWGLMSALAGMFCAAPLMRAEEAGELIRFRRPSRVGQTLSCRIQAAMAMRTVKVLGDGREEETHEHLGLEIAGDMRVTALTERQQPATVEFTVKAAAGQMAGRDFAPNWNGRTLVIDFTRALVCEFRMRDSDETLPDEEVRLLSLVFRPAPEETMADLLGGERRVAVGGSWALETGGLVRRIVAQGMSATPAQVTGTATLKGRRTVRGLPCWEVGIVAATSGIPEYEFSLSVDMVLPEDERHGPILLERQGREVMRQRMPPEEPLAVNLREVRLEMNDRMTAEFTPRADAP